MLVNKNNIYYHIIIIIIFTILIRSIYIYKSPIEKFTLSTEYDAHKLIVTPKTYIYCDNSFFNVMEDYLVSFYKQLNAKIIVYNTVDEIPNLNSEDIYIFVKYLSDYQLKQLNSNTKNVYLINTEQLTGKQERERVNSYPKYIKILDYSKANLKYLDKEYYTKFLQYQINYDEIYDIPKSKMICMMKNNHNHISDYRQVILTEIKNKNNNINIEIISGWKFERDYNLFSHKIILNLCNLPDYNIFESIRCDRCIFNKMIIISDKKEDYEKYYFNKYIIFEDYNKIADKVIDVYNNYDKYYKKLGFDKLDIKTLPIEPVSL